MRKVAQWLAWTMCVAATVTPAVADGVGQWTQRLPSGGPSARADLAMAYDAAHGQIVLFGGNDSSTAAFSDTWVWDGINWTQKQPPTGSPAARVGHAMAYD